MLHSIKQLYGLRLGAAEGPIGHVKDFYFDDRRWVVRYVVVDTGSWLSERLVLISPHVFGSFYQGGHSLLVNLTRDQIENSPSIDANKPVSQQFEKDYYQYYGWTPYWNGNDLWGRENYPMPTPHLTSASDENHGGVRRVEEDSHLRSTRTVCGYQIQAAEEAIGQVADFMIDDQSWEIRHLVVATGGWFGKKEVALSPSKVERISDGTSEVMINVTKETIRDFPEYHPRQVEYHDSRNFDD